MARVVSLVPSATETLAALGIPPVACTRFCGRADLPSVGGTKDPDVAAIVALAPDLVVVNDEENRHEDAVALRAAGLAVHSLSPRSVGEVERGVAELADRLGVAAPTLTLPAACPVRARAVILVWRRPWIVVAADTYGASVLEHLGFASAVPRGALRYPSLDADALRALAPDVVILPDEPYPFGPRHVPEVAAAVGPVPIVAVDGRDLFWWGTRTPDAVARLAAVLAES